MKAQIPRSVYVCVEGDFKPKTLRTKRGAGKPQHKHQHQGQGQEKQPEMRSSLQLEGSRNSSRMRIGRSLAADEGSTRALRFLRVQLEHGTRICRAGSCTGWSQNFIPLAILMLFLLILVPL